MESEVVMCRLPPSYRAAPRKPSLPDAAIFGLILVAIFGCRDAAGARGEKVRVTGASTIYPIVVMAGEALRDSGVIVEAQAGGSSRGFEDTVAGRNDLGAMARDPTAEERAVVRTYPIAYDGVGVVVHAGNPIAALTTEDLRRIYTREIRNWSELGGGDEPIVAVTKAAGHATLETFLEHTGLARAELEADVVAGDNAQVIRVVANTENAVGYVSLGEVLHAIESDMPLRLVPLDGAPPTLEAVASKQYPMYRTLYLVAREEPAGASRRLLDFLRGPDGREIIERGRYVPLER